MDSAVHASNLTKEYRLYPGSVARLKELMSFGKRKYHRAFRALDDVSFEVPRGSALGVIGENGAGKSTLLKILAGTTLATSGSFVTDGKVASLLELGTGFHTEFTGRANIYLAGQVQGFTRREIDDKLESIIDFAELGEYIDQPVRTYSSGMVMRLGFSVATAIDPDVLIIDEILAVGDLYFQKKCVDRIFDFRRRGKSILFCSHSLYDVRQVCDEVIWIRDGHVEARGLPAEVTVNYGNFERSQTSDPGIIRGERELIEAVDKPRIDAVRLVLDAHGANQPLPDLVKPGSDLAFEIDFEVFKPGAGVNVGAAVFRTDNVMAASFNSLLQGMEKVSDVGRHRCRMTIPDLRLGEGEYTVVGYLFDETGLHVYDHRQQDRNLLVVAEENQPGLVLHHHAFTVEPLRDDVPAPEVDGP